MSIESIKIPPEEAKKIRESDDKRRSRSIEADAYDDFTESGKPFFFKCIDIIEKNEMRGGIL